jgi:8-oxo-dGTP pyrophosphatase MutT (NUDIX family)
VKRDRILAALRAHDPLTLPQGTAQAAAVLVPITTAADGSLEIILTRRTVMANDPHSGQVSFPGGRMEPEDGDCAAAALREAHEELGIPPECVEIIGRLDDMLTVTGYHIVPLVAWIAAGTALEPSPVEVARVFTIPLSELLCEQGWELRSHEYRGSEVRVWHFPYDGEDVWGATAWMLRGMLAVLRRFG